MCLRILSWEKIGSHGKVLPSKKNISQKTKIAMSSLLKTVPQSTMPLNISMSNSKVATHYARECQLQIFYKRCAKQ